MPGELVVVVSWGNPSSPVRVCYRFTDRARAVGFEGHEARVGTVIGRGPSCAEREHLVLFDGVLCRVVHAFEVSVKATVG